MSSDEELIRAGWGDKGEANKRLAQRCLELLAKPDLGEARRFLRLMIRVGEKLNRGRDFKFPIGDLIVSIDLLDKEGKPLL
jgi:hypothetical protein